MSFVARERGGPAMRAVVLLGLCVFVLWSAAPVVWLLLSSMLQQKALIAQPPDLSPANFTLDNFVTVLSDAAALGRGMLNSLVVALFSTAVSLSLGAPAAYALARLPVPRANALSFLILATQMLPGIAIAIPLFIAISRLGLIDFVLSLGFVYLSFNLPVVVGSCGASSWGFHPGSRRRPPSMAPRVATFWHIVLPISVPPLAAAAVFAFIEAWNEFFFALDPDASAGPDRTARDRSVRRPLANGLRTNDGRGGDQRHASDPPRYRFPRSHRARLRRRHNEGLTVTPVELRNVSKALATTPFAATSISPSAMASSSPC